MRYGSHKILVGDVREQLATLTDESVHCVVTSPPYWGLRDYGTADWEGGDAGCDHIAPPRGGRNPETAMKQLSNAGTLDYQYTNTCGKCGAKRIDSQLGLEPTPGEFIENMVAVFREVRRVLRSDGTCWMNMGDSYWNGGAEKRDGGNGFVDGGNKKLNDAKGSRLSIKSNFPGLKPKDLCMMPARLAIALQADGWWLRSDIIWAKPNPMPESCTDRPTKSHEHMFLLTKSAKYYYDDDAVREPVPASTIKRLGQVGLPYQVGSSRAHAGRKINGNMKAVGSVSGRNLRDVWTITTQPFSEAHFATFPEKLVEPCIKAGTSEKGCCPECGCPWVRVVERVSATPGQKPGYTRDCTMRNDGERAGCFVDHSSKTIGWKPGCGCDAGDPIPCTVLDLFSGAGTTGIVACKLGRDYIGIELNPEYAEMSRNRICKALNPSTHRDNGKIVEGLFT